MAHRVSCPPGARVRVSVFAVSLGPHRVLQSLLLLTGLRATRPLAAGCGVLTVVSVLVLVSLYSSYGISSRSPRAGTCDAQLYFWVFTVGSMSVWVFQFPRRRVT